MRTLVLSFLTMGLVIAAEATAQEPHAVPAVHLTVMQPPPVTRRMPFVSPEHIVKRILSFDRNGDERVSHEELPERMHGLLESIDKDRDGFLTSLEVRSASNTRITFTSSPPRPPSENSGVVGVVNDLKLPPQKHEAAMAVARRYTVAGNGRDPVSMSLLDDMRAVLDGEDYENFAAAAARLRFTNVLARVTSTVGGVTVLPK